MQARIQSVDISHFLAPAFAARLFPGLFLPIVVAELSLALWLAAKGVNDFIGKVGEHSKRYYGRA